MNRPQPVPAYRYSKESRAIVLCLGFVLLLTGISIRLIHLQHTRHKAVMAKVKDVTFRSEFIPARRGDVLDRDHRPLATTKPVSVLLLDKHQLPSGEVIHEIAAQELQLNPADLAHYSEAQNHDLYFQLLAEKLAVPLKQSSADIHARLRLKSKNLVIQKQLNTQLVREVVDQLKREKFSGLKIEDSMDRLYVSDDLACHVLGYVNHYLDGVSGIEQSMDHFLKGEDGECVYNTHGELHEKHPAEHGKHVVLTIDAAFQTLVERIMDQQFQALTPHAMTAIFADPATGEILALVNRPGFDPEEGANAKPKTAWKTVDPKWNTAVSSVYEPGSTFKIVTHGAAMDQRLISLDSWVNCHNGYYNEDGWKGSLEDSAEGRPSASVRDVIAYSLNTGTFMVAQQMNAGTFLNYMKRFRLGDKTGIRLPGEASGKLLPTSRIRDRFTLSRLGMGYNINASPLQILGLMSVVCNQGNLVKPRIVREILSPNHREVTAVLESGVVEDVVSIRAARALKNALIHAVAEGTGKAAQVEGYVVGGKTGTAGKAINGRYYENRNLTSFLGFIGTEEAPALMGIVLVDDPKNSGKRQGGSVAAPIFKEIADAGMHHFGIRRLTASVD